MSSSVPIVVNGLGDAEVIEFEAALESTVQTLKHHIADVHRIAPGCQVLLKGETLLSDGECIRNLLEGDSGPLSLTLILSTEEPEEAYVKLSARSSEKLAALEAIGSWFSRGTGDERAIRAVAAQFAECGPPLKKPGPSSVQQLAAKTLQEIAMRGDDVAVAEVISFLDSRGQVQEIAFMTLPGVVETGDERALTALYKYLEHDHESVRNHAFASLEGVAGKGNADAIAQTVKLLSHPEPGVRESAAQCLGKIAEKSDKHTILALSEVKDDPVGCVKRAATQALEMLAAE